MMPYTGSKSWSEGFRKAVECQVRRTNVVGLMEIGFEAVDSNIPVPTNSPPQNLIVIPPQAPSRGEFKSVRAMVKSIKSTSHDISFINMSMFSPSCKVCQLQFKHVFRDYVIPLSVLAENKIDLGSFLIVESHINPYLIDLGIVTTLWSVDEYLDHKRLIGKSLDEEENFLGTVLRVATTKERAKLPLKRESEGPALTAAKQIVQELGLHMDVYVAEYQFDGRILYLYYTAASRVDYRELVRQMVEACNNTRVKMKKTNLCRKFIPKRYASVGLESGSLTSKSDW